jgi:hypothetical protein
MRTEDWDSGVGLSCNMKLNRWLKLDHEDGKTAQD